MMFANPKALLRWFESSHPDHHFKDRFLNNIHLYGTTVIFKILKKRFELIPVCPGQKAGKLFANGHNCTQAVLQATTGRKDRDIMKMAKAFGGGISDRKCLCGAVTGGLMALALKGKSNKSGELIDRFRKDQGATCCVALSRGLKWKSKEHRNNCRRITEETARTVSDML